MQPGIRCLTTQFYTLDQLGERRDGRLVRGDGRGFVLTAAGETHGSYTNGIVVAAHIHPSQAFADEGAPMRGRRAFVEALKAEPFESFKVSPGAVAVCQLGDLGTARWVLKRRPLRSAGT